MLHFCNIIFKKEHFKVQLVSSLYSSLTLALCMLWICSMQTLVEYIQEYIFLFNMGFMKDEKGNN